MKLRKATMEDAPRLLAWRNDPETRANSRNQDMVTAGEHLDWMKDNVSPGNRDQFVVVAEDERGLIGAIRFSSRDTEDNCEVGINIAPERRGEGHGGRMLAEACSRMKGFLIAEIKSTNIPSRKIFEQCGFEQLSEHKGCLLYRRPKRETV